MKEVTSYQTADGKLFASINEATKHEAVLNNRKVYRIDYGPDLTEGRGLQKYGFIIVEGDRTLWLANLLVENWCFVKWGNRVAFVQGTCPTDNWQFTKLSTVPEIHPDKILATL